MGTSDGKIYINEDFSFQLAKDTFTDDDDAVEISVSYESDDHFVDLPSNHWLFYSPATL